MSNIYITEPPTSGRVLLSTSKGDLEVELWSKECPKACRNFIALALEGYYDEMVWHRIVPGFCVQSGDPTGTGTGGESFYGAPFADEPHQRLRFNRRGLLAMANPGERDHNESQFFLTLDATPELQNKHTLFGRISGPTIYNLLALSEVELSATEPDRPVFPPKLHTVKVLDNPFDDIVPRITREERRAQEANKRRAKAEAAEGKRRGEKVKKKNTGLLSFGEAEDGDEGDGDGRFKKAPMSSHDLLKNDRRLRGGVDTSGGDDSNRRAGSSTTTTAEAKASDSSTSSAATPAPAAASTPPVAPARKKRKSRNDDDSAIDLSAIRANHAAANGEQSTADRIRAMEASIRGMTAAADGDADKSSSKSSSSRPARKGKELLAAVRAKYKSQSDAGEQKKRSRREDRDGGGGGDAQRERDTMELLKKFQSGSASKSERRERDRERDREAAERKHPRRRGDDDVDDDVEPGMREYGASDDDDGDGDGAHSLSSSAWRSHRFQSSKADAAAAAADADDTYVTLDPRDTTSAQAAQMGFGTRDDQSRAREERVRREGREGRDWVRERGERSERSERSERGGRGERSERGGGGGGGERGGSRHQRDGRWNDHRDRDRRDPRDDRSRRSDARR